MCFCQPPRLFQPPRLLTLEVFAILPVYCTLPVYYFGRNLPASPFIPSSPSIWHSRVCQDLITIHTSSLINIEEILNIHITTKFYNGNDVMYLWQDYGSLKRVQLLFIRNIIFYKKQWQQMYIKFWKLNVKVPIIRI